MCSLTLHNLSRSFQVDPTVQGDSTCFTKYLMPIQSELSAVLPAGLTVDYEAGRLWWVNRKQGGGSVIYSCNFDGSEAVPFEPSTTWLTVMSSITLHADRVFFARKVGKERITLGWMSTSGDNDTYGELQEKMDDINFMKMYERNRPESESFICKGSYMLTLDCPNWHRT